MKDLKAELAFKAHNVEFHQIILTSRGHENKYNSCRIVYAVHTL